MDLPKNQRKIIEQKLRIYNEPFIDKVLLQKILDKFAPKYQIKTLTTRKLIAPIIKGKLYFNHLSNKTVGILETTILAQYAQGKMYVVGGLGLYNQYHFSEQLVNRTTVYTNDIRGKRRIAGAGFIFRQVRNSFFRGMEEKNAQGYGTYFRMTPERALIQLIKEKNGQLEYEEDIYGEIRQKAVSIKKLLSLSEQYTSKRVQLLVRNFLKEGHLLK